MTAGYSVAPRVRDRVLARHGDPMTGQVFDYPRPGWSLEQRHQHRIWDVRLVRATVTDDSRPLTFFWGGRGTLPCSLICLTACSLLEVDVATLNRRLDARLADEFGSTVEERALVIRVHRTREVLPVGSVSIDATRPPAEVVDEILHRVEDKSSP
jgi:hypothetical protein